MHGHRSLAAIAILACACADDGAAPVGADTTTGPATTGGPTSTTMVADGSSSDSGTPVDVDVHAFANGCWILRSGDTALGRTAGDVGYVFGGSAEPFFLEPSDLGTYLLYDTSGGYVVGDGATLLRETVLQSDVTLVDDAFISGAEWIFEVSPADPSGVVLRSRKTGGVLGATGVVSDDAAALTITLEAADACLEHPELTVDATGTVEKTTFEDGTLWGIVDTHSHIHSNFGFGGGGIFHGGAYHRLGVQHALPDCEQFHGEMGRKDFFGFAFDTAGADGTDIGGFLPDLVAGELSEDNHITDGYPDFTEWPAAPSRSTHQTQYWRWLERAWLSGLRLVVQHATTNSVICHMTAGSGVQPVRYSCDDMVAVDRIIDETYAMERYIDAQSGGPGMGWFRVVGTPAEAREVIAAGKMAVILGIETSDLFDCRLTPRGDSPVCDEAYVRAVLDEYYERGVRAIFPVHKYDNAFSPGDGDRAFIEVGNFFNSGHYSNFTDVCPGAPGGFDHGDVSFGGLNMPRDEYDAPAPLDFEDFPTSPLATAFPYISTLDDPPLVGEYCQNATVTPLGELLMLEMMARGMIIEVDHLPQNSYLRAFELLQENDYPAVGSHGRTNDGILYQLGGVSKTSLGRCRGAEPGEMVAELQDRIALIEDNGGYPGEGFGFDLNGFAGARGPRFVEGACATEQTDPITYPFTSHGGDIEFTEPSVGNRVIDFNTEGMVHIGMLPELLEDARRDAADPADLDPLFRSAEAYIRMWERAEARAMELR